jgi:hypothetical protein
MSKWVEGNMDLRCSLNILRQAICNVVPEWEDYIMVDPNGELEMYRYNGAKVESSQGGSARKANLIIPGGGNPAKKGPSSRNVDNDWGFALDDKGEWTTIFADYNINNAKSFENKVIGEVGRLRALAYIKHYGGQLVNDESNDDECTTIIRMDNDKARQFLDIL